LALAAKAENMIGAVLSEDSIATIDDILSMAKGHRVFRTEN
jgi:hypothetical protein